MQVSDVPSGRSSAEGTSAIPPVPWRYGDAGTALLRRRCRGAALWVGLHFGRAAQRPGIVQPQLWRAIRQRVIT